MRHKRRAQLSIGVDMDPQVIERWRSEQPRLCELVHADAASFLAGYDWRGDELVYADPPYVPSTRRRTKIYQHEYSVEDHVRLLKMLRTLPCRVMLSGYDSDLYASALPDWRKATFSAKTHAGVREECVWMNFEPPDCLHDNSHLGHTFRERQTIRRRHARMVSRFDEMDTLERNALLQLLNDHFGFVSETP